MTQDRTTKYMTAVRYLMKELGHATNGELLVDMRKSYPYLSATTVHRITTRMVERGELQVAPSTHDNVLRLDVNLAPHDHFICRNCGMLRDANLGNVVRPQIEKAIGEDCSISGNLVVSGICKKCSNKPERR